MQGYYIQSNHGIPFTSSFTSISYRRFRVCVVDSIVKWTLKEPLLKYEFLITRTFFLQTFLLCSFLPCTNSESKWNAPRFAIVRLVSCCLPVHYKRTRNGRTSVSAVYSVICFKELKWLPSLAKEQDGWVWLKKVLFIDSVINCCSYKKCRLLTRSL